MQTVGLNYESHQEISGALLRAERGRKVATPGPSDLVKLTAVVLIGAGVVLDGIAVLISLTVLGAAALWLSFHHDDAVVERGVEDLFDSRTGLPLAEGLETVLSDDLVAGSLSGRFAIVSVEVPEIAAREVANDHGAAEALMVSVTHRLQSHGWIGRAGGPFGPLVFLRRPGVFFVVLRDVIDDRTTRWLAGRMLDIVNRPVRWNGGSLDPRAVIGLAVGNVADRLDLVRQSSEARQRARREGRGAVVGASDLPGPHAAQTWLVSIEDETAVGRLIDPVPAGGEMFAELAALLRALDEAFDVAAATGARCFVRTQGAALCHWDAPARIAARVNAAGMHGQVGIVVPSDLADRSTRLAWENLEQIRGCGLDLYIDRSDARITPRGAPDPLFDGIVTVAGDSEEMQERRAQVMIDARENGADAVIVSLLDLQPDPAVPELTAVVGGSVLAAVTAPGFPGRPADEGTDRTVHGGRSAQFAQGVVIPAR
jgi:hypothetical protein